MFKTVDEIINFLNDENKVEDIRTSIGFSDSNKIWNEEKYNRRSNIGDLMEQINTLKPKDQNQWYSYYLDTSRKDNNNFSRARSINELNKISKNFQKSLEENNIHVSEDEAQKYVLIRTMYETYVGYQREENTINRLQKFLGNEFKIEKADRDVDTKYNIDIFAINTKTNEQIIGFQIKSEQFQTAYHNNIRQDVTEENEQGFKEYLNDRGVPSIFIFADKNGKINDGVLDYVDFKVELAYSFKEFLKENDTFAFDRLSDRELKKIEREINEIRRNDEPVSKEWDVFVKNERKLNRHLFGYKEQER